jgi:hypothetical protein
LKGIVGDVFETFRIIVPEVFITTYRIETDEVCEKKPSTASPLARSKVLA